MARFLVQEIEFKLTCSPATLAEIQKHIAANHNQHESRCIVSHYFDTKDLDLLTAGFVLRVRKIDETFIQTLKTNEDSQDGLHKRKEWEHQVKYFEPDLEHLNALVPDNLLQTLQKKSLVKVFTTDFVRTDYHIDITPHHKVELALDKGKVIAGQLFSPICEVEIELLQGKEYNVIEFANELKKQFELQPENQSKAERGFKLWHQTLRHD